MKLLIVTQIVDTEDPILGFFSRWIEEFAKHVEHLEVICLKEGKHHFPKNVSVHSLGKERGEVSRLTYAVRFLDLVWRLRGSYDTVFVHMNPEYLVVAGWLWRVLGKRVALWYTHKSADIKLRIALLTAQVVFTASKESFRLHSKKLHVMGHGIDTDFFSPGSPTTQVDSVLSAGRLSKVKRNDLIIRAASHFSNPLRIVGDGPELKNLEALVQKLSLTAQVTFVGATRQEVLRDEYRNAKVFLHASETGSLDKVVLEALACGLPVVTTSAILADLPVTIVSSTPEDMAAAVVNTRNADASTLSQYVREHHSLNRLVGALITTMEAI